MYRLNMLALVVLGADIAFEVAARHGGHACVGAALVLFIFIAIDLEMARVKNETARNKNI